MVFLENLELFRTSDSLSVGVNILPNDYQLAIKLANDYGMDFIQMDYVAGKYENTQPIDVNHYFEIRKKYPKIKVLGGVHPNYENVRVTSDEEDIMKLKSIKLENT